MNINMEIDHLRFWVENAPVYAKYLQLQFGFEAHAIHTGTGVTVKDGETETVEDNGLSNMVEEQEEKNEDGNAEVEIDTEGCVVNQEFAEVSFQPHRSVHVVKQGNVVFALVSPTKGTDSVIQQAIQNSGDAVRDIVFRVNDVDGVYHKCVEHGAAVVESPKDVEDEYGVVRTASVLIPEANLVHTFLDRSGYAEGRFFPGFSEAQKGEKQEESKGLFEHIDHLAIVVPKGRAYVLSHWYQETLGLVALLVNDDDHQQTENLTIEGKIGGLRTKVLGLCDEKGTHAIGKLKLVLVEPTESHYKGQIEEFLEYNYGAGVQHIALHAGNMETAVTSLKEASLPLIDIPDTYYEGVKQWQGIEYVAEDIELEVLQKLGILVDVMEDELDEDTGSIPYLLQTFTKPIHSRPTLFFELICRKNGYSGFGQRNIAALFEAVQKARDDRGE